MDRSALGRSFVMRGRITLTIARKWRKINNMETYTHTESKPAYGWLALAALATALLMAVAFLTVPVMDMGEEAYAAATAVAMTYNLRLLLIVPLLCVAPALWARCAFRVHPWTLGVLTVLAYVVAFGMTRDALSALSGTLLIAPAGILLYAMQRRKMSNFATVFYTSIILLGGLFLWIGLKPRITNGDAFYPLRQYAEAVTVTTNELISMLGLTEEQIANSEFARIKDMLTDLKLYPESYMIELLYYPAALAALASGLLSHLFNKRKTVDLTPLPPFAEWKVEAPYFYGTLALSVVSYVLALSGVSYGNGLLSIAYALWILPMSLAGLCAVKRMTTGRPWLFAVACVFTGMFFSMAGMLLATVGTLSFMHEQMRKRMEERKK